MMTTVESWRAALAFGLALAIAPSAAHAGLIMPVSVAGAGSFSGNASVITDGVIPPRGTVVTDSRVVSWNAPSTAFTIDFGSVQTVANLIVAVDNNDSYLIKSSTDGINYTNLFTFLASDGPVTAAQGGLDLLTTDSTYPSFLNFPGDSTTPEYVGRGFAATAARYLQVSAISGDSVYAIGEVDAYTPNTVPEPASILLTATALLGGLGLRALRQIRPIASRTRPAGR